MKKFLSVLLAAAFTVLCGCSANTSEQTSAVSESVSDISENVQAVQRF